MNIDAWKDLTISSRINGLIEELRWGRYEFFDLVDVESVGEEAVITLPKKSTGQKAIVVVLTRESHRSEEEENQ